MPTARKHINQAFEESKLPQSGRSKKIYWILLALLAALFVISAVIAQFLPTETPPVQQNTWQGITPGYKITSTISSQLGSPIKVEKLAGERQELSYDSQDFKSFHTTVTLSQEGTVDIIKIPVAYNEDNLLQNYTSDLGTADLELYDTSIGLTAKAHIFLEKGVVIIANETTGVVEGIWYFEPTTEEVFLNTWGTDLSKDASEPEAFPGL